MSIHTSRRKQIQIGKWPPGIKKNSPCQREARTAGSDTVLCADEQVRGAKSESKSVT